MENKFSFENLLVYKKALDYVDYAAEFLEDSEARSGGQAGMVASRTVRHHPRFVSSSEKRPRATLALWIRLSKKAALSSKGLRTLPPYQFCSSSETGGASEFFLAGEKRVLLKRSARNSVVSSRLFNIPNTELMTQN